MTEEITSRIRIRFEHAAARKTLLEKYQSRMLFAHAGGMWQSGPELLNLLNVCKDDTVVLLDVYQTPVKVQVSELKEIAHQRWQEQMTAWLIEWDQLQKQR